MDALGAVRPLPPGNDEAARFKRYWVAWGDHLPLEIVESPYRASG